MAEHKRQNIEDVDIPAFKQELRVLLTKYDVYLEFEDNQDQSGVVVVPENGLGTHRLTFHAQSYLDADDLKPEDYSI